SACQRTVAPVWAGAVAPERAAYRFQYALVAGPGAGDRALPVELPVAVGDAGQRRDFQCRPVSRYRPQLRRPVRRGLCAAWLPVAVWQGQPGGGLRPAPRDRHHDAGLAGDLHDRAGRAGGQYCPRGGPAQRLSVRRRDRLGAPPTGLNGRFARLSWGIRPVIKVTCPIPFDNSLITTANSCAVWFLFASFVGGGRGPVVTGLRGGAPG